MNPRPASILVFGVLNLVFGVMGVCGNAIGFAGLFMPQGPNVDNPVLQIMNDHAWYRTVLMVMLGVSSALSIALIAAGIALLSNKPWGRTLSIVYAALTLAQLIPALVLNGWVYQQLMNNIGNNPRPEEMGAIIGASVGGIGGACCGAIYPLVLLFFMFRPEVIQALHGATDADNALGQRRSIDPNNPYQSP